MVYISNERKVRKLCGQPETTQDPSVFDQIVDIISILHVHPMSEQQWADFVFSNLEGSAQEEIRYGPKDVRHYPETIFEVLLNVFGDGSSVSLNHLQR